MARYFRNNFINPHIYSRGIAKLIFCWDFTVTHESAVKLKQKNLSTEIRVRRASFKSLPVASLLSSFNMPVTFLKVIIFYFLFSMILAKKRQKPKTILSAQCWWWCREMNIFTQRGDFVIDISLLKGSLTIYNTMLNTYWPHSSRFIILSSGFWLGADLPQRHGAMSGGFFDCCCRGVCITSI